MMGGGECPGNALRIRSQVSCVTLPGSLSLSGLQFPTFKWGS